jgi:hypothetical protein
MLTMMGRTSITGAILGIFNSRTSIRRVAVTRRVRGVSLTVGIRWLSYTGSDGEREDGIKHWSMKGGHFA